MPGTMPEREDRRIRDSRHFSRRNVENHVVALTEWGKTIRISPQSRASPGQEGPAHTYSSIRSGPRKLLTKGHRGCTFTAHQRAAGLNPERTWWSKRRRVWRASAGFVGVLLLVCALRLRKFAAPDLAGQWLLALRVELAGIPFVPAPADARRACGCPSAAVSAKPASQSNCHAALTGHRVADQCRHAGVTALATAQLLTLRARTKATCTDLASGALAAGAPAAIGTAIFPRTVGRAVRRRWRRILAILSLFATPALCLSVVSAGHVHRASSKEGSGQLYQYAAP